MSPFIILPYKAEDEDPWHTYRLKQKSLLVIVLNRKSILNKTVVPKN